MHLYDFRPWVLVHPVVISSLAWLFAIFRRDEHAHLVPVPPMIAHDHFPIIQDAIGIFSYVYSVDNAVVDMFVILRMKTTMVVMFESRRVNR